MLLNAETHHHTECPSCQSDFYTCSQHKEEHILHECIRAWDSDKESFGEPQILIHTCTGHENRLSSGHILGRAQQQVLKFALCGNKYDTLRHMLKMQTFGKQSDDDRPQWVIIITNPTKHPPRN